MQLSFSNPSLLAYPVPQLWAFEQHPHSRTLIRIPDPEYLLSVGQANQVFKGVRGVGRVGVVQPGSASSIASVAAAGAATTGAILASLSPALAMAGPIGAAVAGLTAVGIAIASLFQGCGQTCVAATNIANQVSTYLQQNLQHYMNANPRYRSLQLAALNNFDTAWTALVQGCSDPSLGQAGAACISERQRGGVSQWCCNSPTSTPAGQCKTGEGNMVNCCSGCDMFVTLRDPIANDPNVVPDPVAGSTEVVNAQGQVVGTTTAAGGSGSGFPMPLLLIAAGVVLFMTMEK